MQVRKNISELMLVIVFLFIFSGLASAAPWLGSGDANDPYQIWDACDVNTLGTETGYYTSHFKMMADVNMADFAYTTAVIAADPFTGYPFDGTKFSGVFDGNDCVIRNLTIDTLGVDNEYIGLFGFVESGTVIKNLGLENVQITAGSGSRFIGGLVGYLLVDWDEYISISNCYSTGSISGGSNAGGLIGYNIWLGDTACPSRCYSTCSVTGDDVLGGLIGSNSGVTNKCYATGSVSGDSYIGGFSGMNYDAISECYSTGLVSGNSNVGGLIGYKGSGGTVSDGFWDKETSGVSTSAGGTGKTTKEMMQQATYTNWDFVDTWTIGERQSYPLLRRYSGADLSYDRQVNFYDFAIFADHWLIGVQ